ncbi:ammonium transporter Rh type A-like [Mya arenaria]|uniref:ammonium transporter Rh type A-like n=1 Tax=Mya arenaria TaxID=6604 RepID=UPI0022E8B430|nr:ammonium transporter Rh type A-like [Mya arenaria]
MNWRRIKFPIFLICFQVLFLLLFAVLGEYGEDARPKMPGDSAASVKLYPYFQDVHVMIFIGFGFLMTFLKRYGFGAVSINLLIAAFVIQWAFIVRGIIHSVAHGHGHAKFPIYLGEMLSADFAAATVLISFGAVLGKASPIQLIVMALIEVVLAQINEWIGLDIFGAVDIGESMYIHAFGAYFGLAVARVLYNDKYDEARSEGSVYHSDIFSMIGTVFLWIFWPSFNGGAADGDEQQRALINTYLSLAACTVVTFALSQLVDKRGKLNMVHVQNATLAGGVALGTSANMPLQPWVAMLIGCIAGTISVVGYQYLTPVLHSKLKIHDTCGVNNLHGMPGILAGLVGAIMAAMASTDGWGESVYEIFPLMIPMENSTEYASAVANFSVTAPGPGRSSTTQGGYQMLALVITLVIAIVGGALTGLLLRMPCFDNVDGKQMFDDREFFIVEGQGFPSNEEEAIEEGNDTKLRMLSD